MTGAGSGRKQIYQRGYFSALIAASFVPLTRLATSYTLKPEAICSSEKLGSIRNSPGYNPVIITAVITSNPIYFCVIERLKVRTPCKRGRENEFSLCFKHT
jgi:hypothetical protein